MENIKFDAIKILEKVFEGAYIVDKNRKILYWNDGCKRITGYSKDEVENSYCYQNILKHVDESGRSLCKEHCPLLSTLKTGVENKNDVYLHHKQGHRVPVSIKSFPIYDENNQIAGAIEVFTDTRFKENKYHENQKLKKLVDYDQLTGLYNRRYFDFQLQAVINEYNKFGYDFGILFIDIDNFKRVNDNFGHMVGDDVLKTIANTIANNIRPYDFACRFGGEEITVILKRIDQSVLKMVSERIRVLCENSYIQYPDKQVSVTVSIGGTIYKGNESVQDFIHRADQLMYQSKQNGRNKVTLG